MWFPIPISLSCPPLHCWINRMVSVGWSQLKPVAPFGNFLYVMLAELYKHCSLSGKAKSGDIHPLLMNSGRNIHSQQLIHSPDTENSFKKKKKSHFPVSIVLRQSKLSFQELYLDSQWDSWAQHFCPSPVSKHSISGKIPLSSLVEGNCHQICIINRTDREHFRALFFFFFPQNYYFGPWTFTHQCFAF